jgi:hypothetical protein
LIRSAWFSRESFAGLFASGAWADVALLARNQSLVMIILRQCQLLLQLCQLRTS